MSDYYAHPELEILIEQHMVDDAHHASDRAPSEQTQLKWYDIFLLFMNRTIG